MKKIAQIIMYVIPLFIVVGVLALLVINGRNVQTESDEMQAESGENERVEEQDIFDNKNTESREDMRLPATEDEIEIEHEVETEVESETKVTEDTTILFAGDVLFAKAFKAGYDADGIAGVIDEALLAELQEADIFMVNNEFPFSEQGEPMEGKQYTFQCEPAYVTALQEMGVDVVSLANNHVLDYGKEALRDTFKTLDAADILYGGAGETVERAEAVQIIEVNGRKYGFLAVSRVVPTGDWKVENSAPGVFSCYDDTRLIELVEEASEECDFLAVYPHWGVEYQSYPEDYQAKIAERCFAAGADVVVGSHTHCLQGVEYIADKPVFYSLGNFVFGQTIDRSAIVKVTITAEGNVSYQYLPVYASGGVTYLATDEKAEQIYTYLNQISMNAELSRDGFVTKKNN